MKITIELSTRQIDRLLYELDECTLVKKKETELQRLEQIIIIAIADWFKQRDYWRKVDKKDIMGKVFCSNCKWWYHWNSSSSLMPMSESRCTHPNNYREVHNVSWCASSKSQCIIRDESKINARNDCTWYKRKWWKYWV